MSRMSELSTAVEMVQELEGMGVERRFALIQAADECGFDFETIETAVQSFDRTGGSMARVDMEIEATLKDGRLVHIVGHVDLYEGCLCHESDGPHRHIEDMEIESVIQLYDAGTVDGGEIDLNSKDMVEIEQIIEDEAYSQAS